MVELLVTIIIAGIAFAALVPVFVGAPQVASGEQQRNAALSLAQDKLEKVRGLDYDLITQAGLTGNTVPNGQFGSPVSWATGGGGTRSYTVTYVVDNLPVGSLPGAESYKQVTITVAWTGNPKPVKPVVLSTMVSKQYAGPQIVRFDIGPPSVMHVESGNASIVSGPVDIDAYIASEDILSMNQAAADANRGYVEFTVTPLNGTAVASQKVTVPVSAVEPGHYTFRWDNSGVSNGVYIFQAVAVAGFGSRAQGMPVSIALNYTNLAPPAPTALTVDSAGDEVVNLGWTPPAAADVDHYEVWRSEDGGVNFAKIADTPAESYQDLSVSNNDTYYYQVKAVNEQGLAGPFSNQVSATPSLPGDTVAPSVPASLVATADAAQPTVHLTWAASIDGGNPPAGLSGYIVERSPNNADPWTLLQSAYGDVFYDDTTAGWSATWYYRVRAVDLVGNASANATAGPVQTVAPIYRSIKVTNTSSTQTYVWVQNAALLTWYAINGTSSASRPASGVWVKKNNNSVTWSNLPSGIYNVYFLSTSSWNSANILKTLAVSASAGNGTAAYP